jgi:hypothetical protein
MATNNFLPFAGGAGANVMIQADYAALAARTTGFVSGTANSAQLNKVWRQSSLIAAAVAQVISDNANVDVLDDGTIATIVTNLKKAVSGRLIGVQVFTATGTYTPTAGTTSVVVEGVGGGGGSGGSAATGASSVSGGTGGGAAAYGKGRFTTGFSGVTVTVGAGGTAATAGANPGGLGGTSSFGALMSMPGGKPGQGGAQVTGNTGTVGSGPSDAPTGANIVSIPGRSSDISIVIPLAIFAASAGGSGPLGTGGVVGSSAVLGAQPGYGYGSGASGAFCPVSTVAQAGGVGRPGIVIVYEYA